MTDPTFMLLYVDDPTKSAAFYADLLGHQPVETAPTFVLFAFGSGLKLGLWSRHTVEPAPAGVAGCAELALAVDDARFVDATHADWSARGVKVLQPPTTLDFGRTFVAVDPDGHRLRVFAPGGG